MILTNADAASISVSIANAAEDLRLRSDAAAVVGAAVDLANGPWMPSVDDIDGRRRPQGSGSGWNPGADEL